MENQNFQEISFDAIKDKFIRDVDDKLSTGGKKNLLFDSHSGSGKKFKNHFCFCSLSDNFLCDNFGNPTDKFSEFYERVSKSGVGLIVTGGAYVGSRKFNNKKSIPKKFACISDDHKNFEGYERVAKAVHTHGAAIFLKIVPIFGRGDCDNKFFEVFNYSASYGKNFYDAKMPSVRLSDGKCREIAEAFGDAASMAQKAGYDGIVIDGSECNILGEFTSPEFNRRKFGYFTDSIDFPRQILREIKQKCSHLFTLYKFTLNSFLRAVYGAGIKNIASLGGLAKEASLSQKLELLSALVKLGVDGFVFEMGTFETAFANDFSPLMCENLYEDILSSVREFFNRAQLKNKFGQDVIIVSQDNFNGLSHAVDQVFCGAVDFADVTKQLYSDNNFLRRVRSGKSFTPCIKCSKCNECAERHGQIYCTVNPELSFDKITQTSRANATVAVVGAGISGINCATWLAKRGFTVDLFDEFKTLNQNGRKNEIFGYDELLKTYNDLLEKQVENLASSKKINLHLGERFEAERARRDTFSAIVVATGFHERFLDVPGAVLKNVKSIFDVLGNKRLLSGKNNVTICAKSELSLKLAIYLLKSNKNVSVVLENPEFLFKLSNGKFSYYVYALKALHASVYVGARVKRIEEDFYELAINFKRKKSQFDVSLVNLKSKVTEKTDFRVRNIDCDLFIYEPETYPNNKLYYELVKSGFSGELYLIGNALEIAGMDDDIRSAYFVAKNL